MGKLDGFTLLFEALVLTLCREMTFAAVARLVNLSWYRVKVICDRYVDLAASATDLSEVTAWPLTKLRADVATTMSRWSPTWTAGAWSSSRRASISIDMSPAFIRGVDKHLPDARATFDKFHVVAHASKALDCVRREQQKTDPALKGMRWSLLKDVEELNLAQLTDLEALISQYTTNRTARSCMYREKLREIPDRKKIHVLTKNAAPVVHRRHAFQGRTYEGRRTHDPSSFRQHRRLGPDAPDQRLH